MRSTETNAPPAVDWIRGLLREHYGLDDGCGIEEILGGYCNRSYRITCAPDNRRRAYLLRQYNCSAGEADIGFEHALLKHLHDKGFELSAQVVYTRDGQSWVRAATAGRRPFPQFWALFTYLDGEDAYSWTHNDLTLSEFASAAEILARFHGAGQDFVKPVDADRAQLPIVKFLPRIKDTFSACLRRAGGRRCDLLFRARFNDIAAAIDACCEAAGRFEGMPELPVHGDYHPGNLKYAGGRAVGLFDFDWSKIDYRLFDVALALVYFCAVWDDCGTPELLVHRMQHFLRVYDQACGCVPPLCEQEYAGLEAMLAAANLYVLNWDVADFYQADAPDDAQYLTYLRHNIGLMDWIQAHGQDIRALTAAARAPHP
jgi:homoserine kinase type II